MEITRKIVVLDAADIEQESAFWATMLGGRVDRSEDWHEIDVNGDRPVAIQLAPDHVRPDWPHGLPQQLHLDLYVPDVRAAHEEVMGIGAELLQEAKDLDAPSGFQVYADPAGHPFCLCWG